MAQRPDTRSVTEAPAKIGRTPLQRVHRAHGLRLIGWVVAAAMCAIVFASYSQAELIIALANQLWTCF